MKAAILTNRADSFQRPMAEGLGRMFAEVGVESRILYDGLEALPRVHYPPMESGFMGRLRRAKEKATDRLAYRGLLRELRAVDFAVIVGHLPGAYMESFFDDERLRRDVPRLPIILYDLAYLPTRGPWVRRILEREGRNRGLDRYDYHLCVTEMSGWPVPAGADWFSAIGVNLADPSLCIEPRETLVALIDFERPSYIHERAVQVQACVDAGIPFKVLHGQYPSAEIRKIYRGCSLYFVAHRESFGLPICELQACGAMVLTPYADWCPSHYLERPDKVRGRLPANFIVYDNNPQVLVRELERLKRDYSADRVLANFLREQPHFYRGDVAALARFVDLVKAGTINALSHRRYPSLAQLVDAIGESPEPVR